MGFGVKNAVKEINNNCKEKIQQIMMNETQILEKKILDIVRTGNKNVLFVISSIQQNNPKIFDFSIKTRIDDLIKRDWILKNGNVLECVMDPAPKPMNPDKATYILNCMIKYMFADNRHTNNRKKPLSKESCKKISEGLRKFWSNEEERKKQSIRLKGKKSIHKNKYRRALTMYQARCIRNEYASGYITQQELAKKYKVSRYIIYRIVRNKGYKET